MELLMEHDMMNTHDRKNLQFLLAADDKTLKKWFRTASPDDQEYAWSLLELYSRELDATSQEMRVEAELAQLSEHYPEAMAVINSIQGYQS
jgi:hypothetical protein